MFAFVLLICIFNGLTSPFVFTLFQLAPAWLPTPLLGSLPVVIYLASLGVTTLTLMLAGVPAALFERATGRTATDPASVSVWMAAAAALSAPGVYNLLSGGVTLF